MNAASVTMMHKTMDGPVPERFFPGLLPIVGDETYARVIARYRELYSSQGLRDRAGPPALLPDA